MIGQIEQRVFVGCVHILQPFHRHAVTEQLVIADADKQGRLRHRLPRRHRLLHLDIAPNRNLFDPLADLYQLRSTGARMRFQLAALGPAIRLIVMIDVTQQQASRGFVHDQADIAADPHRPEVRILRPIEFVEVHSRVCRVQLQIKGCGLHRFLLVAGEAAEAVGEGVGDSEVHL